jgi:2-keto-myo-inositol isomerase
MKLAYHGATHMVSDLVTDIEVTGKSRFSALEIWAKKIDPFLEKNTVSDLKRLLEDNGVEPVSLSSIEFVGFRGDEFGLITDRCRELCETGQAIGCDTVVLVPSPIPDTSSDVAIDLCFPWERVVEEYVDVLRTLSDVAKPYGTRLSFEFIGFHWCSVRTPRGAYEIVQAADRDNLGINFDTCHFCGGGGNIEEIDSLDPSRICAFHINDMEDVPKEAYHDARRLLPGEGCLPLDAICGRLRDIGFDGVCSVELFREEYYRLDPYDLADRAYEASAAVLSRYFKIE